MDTAHLGILDTDHLGILDTDHFEKLVIIDHFGIQAWKQLIKDYWILMYSQGYSDTKYISLIYFLIYNLYVY